MNSNACSSIRARLFGARAAHRDTKGVVPVPECTILQKTEFILAYTCVLVVQIVNKYYFILLLMKVRWNSIHAFCTGLQTANSCDLDDALPSTLVFPVAKQSLWFVEEENVHIEDFKAPLS